MGVYMCVRVFVRLFVCVCARVRVFFFFLLVCVCVCKWQHLDAMHGS